MRKIIALPPSQFNYYFDIINQMIDQLNFCSNQKTTNFKALACYGYLHLMQLAIIKQNVPYKYVTSMKRLFIFLLPIQYKSGVLKAISIIWLRFVRGRIYDDSINISFSIYRFFFSFIKCRHRNLTIWPKNGLKAAASKNGKQDTDKLCSQ